MSGQKACIDGVCKCQENYSPVKSITYQNSTAIRTDYYCSLSEKTIQPAFFYQFLLFSVPDVENYTCDEECRKPLQCVPVDNGNNNNNITNNTNNTKIDNASPNLIVIDGGRGQLSSAAIVLKKMGLNIPVISLAKENEEIFTTSSPEPLQISKKNTALHLLQSVRDEAHRFGLAYNIKLRAIKIK